MAEDQDGTADFHSSELGTKQYWDEAYEKELESFKDMGDVGEIWFGEDVQSRMVRWLSRNYEDASPTILDLGCGNGVMLMELKEEGFENLTGIDYSEKAIDLAKDVAAAQNVEGIIFKQCDLLDASEVKKVCGEEVFDICLDKGTYDAISLRDASSSKDRDLYINHVASVLKPSGCLLITSCNWTKEQLVNHFEKVFVMSSELPAPKFTFGGKTGQTVTSIVFKKKS